MDRVWIVTGCSSGLGKEICLSALARGNKVIATCRGDAETRLRDLAARGAAVLSLDVAAPEEDIRAFADNALAIYGHVDVVCNNAGYVQPPAALEENCSDETLKQFQTLFFGPLNITRAFLPSMRERKTGTIAMIGSQAARTPLPGCGIYIAAKAALASLTSVLAIEVAPFNIQATCIDVGAFRTNVFSDLSTATRHIPEYEEVLAPISEIVNPNYKQRGDPHKGAEHIVDLLTGTGFAKGKRLPMRIPLGDDADEWELFRVESDKGIEEWREWTTGTDFDAE